MLQVEAEAEQAERSDGEREVCDARGQVLATPGALELLQTYQLSPLSFIQRHIVGDWGDICIEDRQVNADALQYGSRLMSVYAITPTETLWIITEADRSCTTLLLPQEY